MKEFKGTKGEWSVCQNTKSVYTDNGLWYDWFHVRTVKEGELLANAKLIAAAPDLLETLFHVKTVLDNGCNVNEMKIDIEKAIEKALK